MPVSSAALTISTIALIEAEQAKDMACKSIVSNYDTKVATVTQMQEYSSCVNRLHPHELPTDAIVVFKILFVLCLLGGVIFAWSESEYRIVDKFMSFMFGAVITLMALICLVGVIVGCVWVIS